ncbi:Ig-like domain-containing protein [Nocardioides sp. 503]|uniref:Ig-like domain-containing protein n=1 Tax=Nocardioides sp. 503 TaxID=2508326 RepID=UPI00142F5260|nr:Ig-like domain-containing protein [Nocardioides sp. 503]
MSWPRRCWSLLASAVLVAVTLAVAPGPAAAQAAPRCTVTGTPGNDVLRGTRHRDVICGRGGNDRLVGKGGNDVLDGGPGDDRLDGGPGNDTLTGGPGDDTIAGGPGADTVAARDGSATRDTVSCGAGADQATGNPRDRVRADCERANQLRPPTGLALSPATVAEGSPPGTVVGSLSTTDADRGDTHRYQLVSGAGGTDNAAFSVVGRTLRTRSVPDFESDARLSVRVRTTDSTGLRLDRVLTVTVRDVVENAAPVAVDDTVGADEDETLTLPVSGPGSPLANDTDADGDPLTLLSVGNAVGGAVALVGGSIAFTPTAQSCEPAAAGFDYTVSDGRGGSDVGRVRVDVTCVEDPPTARDDVAELDEDAPATAIVVLANDDDADDDPLTIGSATQPEHGTVVVAGDGGGLTYAPDGDYCDDTEPDTFSYTLTPGGSTATVEVTVTCVDDAPVAVDDTAGVLQGAAAVTVDVLANDTDKDGGRLAVVSTTQPERGAVEVIAAGTAVRFTPPDATCGPAVFTYELNGGSTATVSVTVGCDEAPVAVDDAVTMTEDDPATPVDVLANDVDADGGPLRVASVSQPGHGTVVVTGDGSGLTYASGKDHCGTDDFTYTLNRGATATVSVTVTCVDDAPVAVDDAVTLTENDPATSVDVLANDTDVDDESVSVGSVTQGEHGTVAVMGGGGWLTYTPDVHFCGTDALTYTLVGGSTATVTVTVTCVDDAPVAVDDDASLDEDAAPGAIDVLTNDTDTDGGPRVIASVTQPDHGTALVTGGGSGLTYAPAPDYCNTPLGLPSDSFTYTLDGGSTAIVRVAVSCVDDAPVAVDDAAALGEDAGPVPLYVLSNDTDVDGGPRAIASVTQASHGEVLVVDGGEGLTYEPDDGYCSSGSAEGPDTFTYTLVGGSTATVSVAVDCVADPVSIHASDGPTTYVENGQPVVVDGDLAVVNPDGLALIGAQAEITDGLAAEQDVLGWVDNDLEDGIVRTTGPAGAVALAGPGDAAEYAAALAAVTYANASDDPATATRTVTFTLTADGFAPSDSIEVEVLAVDDAPVAVDDADTLLEDAGVSVVDVLANDRDPDDPLAIASATDPAHGAVVVTGGGTGLTYVPDADHCGEDSFDYTLVGVGVGAATATVSMTVTCVNDAPVADDETFTGALSAVGNTALVVNDPLDAAPALAGPQKSISGAILAGDADQDGPGPLAVVAGTLESDDGGTVVLESDGDFTFVPAPGASCQDHTDFFDYTVSDASSPTAGTDTGRVTISVTGCVWYVSNRAGDGGGTSSQPFVNLAQAEAASSAGQTVFVFAGDGTSNGYGAGFDLKDGQRLVGQAGDLVVGNDLLWSGLPGARPTLTDYDADVVSLASGNTVTGLEVDPRGGGGIAGGGGDAGGTIDDVRIVDAGVLGSQPGLELDGTSGSWTVADLVVDTAATGVRLVGAGTVDLAGDTSVVTLSSTGAPALDASGTSLGTSHVDELVAAGAGTGGVRLSSTTGSIVLGDGVGTDLDLTTTSGTTAALSLTDAGSVTVAAPGVDDVSATGGPAVDVSGTTVVSLDLDDVDSTGSASDGISLTGLGAGSFTAGPQSVISDAADVDVDLDGGSGQVTFDGRVTDQTGRLVRVRHTSGGVKDFNGPLADGGQGSGQGIALTDNAGATVRFDGGLSLSTGTADALTATGGGALAVTGSANTVRTGSGTALRVTGVTIHDDDLTFRSVSSDGASSGIVLGSTTNAGGGLVVAGDGGACTVAAPTCTGGTIQGSTGPGVWLSDVPGGVSLGRTRVVSGADDGIRATGVAGLSLVRVLVSGNGDAVSDRGLDYVDVTGAVAVTDTVVTGSAESNARVANGVAGTTVLTVSGSTFSSTSPSRGAHGLEVRPDGGARVDVTVTSSTFAANRDAGFLLGNTSGSPTMNLVFSGNTVTGGNASALSGQPGIVLTPTAGAQTRALISDNDISGTLGSAVVVSPLAGSTESARLDATVTDNRIGDLTPSSGSAQGAGLVLRAAGDGDSRFAARRNTIRAFAQEGILVQALDGSGGTADVAVTLTGNVVSAPSRSEFWEGIFVGAGSLGTDDAVVCADIGGPGALENSFVGAGTGPVGDVAPDLALSQRFDTQLLLPGFDGEAADLATYVQGRNAGEPTVQSYDGTPDAQAGACALPTLPSP